MIDLAIDMGEFLPPDFPVKFSSGDELMITVNYPASFGEDFKGSLTKFYKNIFYLRNDKEKVDSVFKKLSAIEISRLDTHFSEKLKDALTGKKKED